MHCTLQAIMILLILKTFFIKRPRRRIVLLFVENLVNIIGNIFTRGAATCENITDGVHSMK